ncbi:OTU domain-containing protein 7B-like isoform X1 [Pieris brassicae]|uniref:OTU domain-containing protein 7B-like isoform X1 n=1 Tax=Pieris brassicae TaxID=7116 RepID=UPI001E65FF17|nr:OTU domain-containing protein 7B-like isoform X1 [Pieris brassicae]
MVIEAATDKHTDEFFVDRVTLRPRAGGDVMTPERSVSTLDLAMSYSAPSNLVLTPAPECRKLSRGISRATDNEGLVWALRSNTEPDLNTLSSDHILLLPDISVYPTDFRIFIEKDLLETATLVTLESASILNWWRGQVPGAPRLLPLATSGDGNCLPHAASLAAYGFHDRLLALRTKVQTLLSGDEGQGLTDAIRRRWRWSESLSLKSAGLTLSEAEWEREWAESVKMASTEPRPKHQPSAAPHYSGLEQLHVFALAHVMRRPVVVFADVALRDFRGDPIAPIPFGGIYLPLELEPASCCKAPILLAYDAGHFSALVPCEPLPSDGARVPLEDPSQNPLPIRFNVDPGEEFRWDVEPDQKTINNLLPDEFQRSAMLEAYMDLERVECLQSHPPEELRRSLDALSTKSSKQMNSVAKQFGSIGRSMSSKLKKNFGSMAKLTGKLSGSQSNPEHLVERQTCEVLCCRVLAARAPVQEEMVKNYLNEAWIGYTSEKNRREEPQIAPRYGTGRSQFYTEADRESHHAANTLTARSVKPAQVQDRTLYLSKSTFYDDRPPSPKPCRAPLCMYYGSPAYNDYCSRCAQQQ